MHRNIDALTLPGMKNDNLAHEDTWRVSLEAADEAMNDLMAGELADAIRQAEPAATVQRIRTEANAQDLGTVLLILGSPALVPIVKALVDWLKSTHKVKIRIKGPQGNLIEADNLTQHGALKLAQAYGIDVGRP